MAIAIMLPIAAGLIGACVASFTATAVLRSQRGEQALRGRSRCDGCASPLGFASTLPVVSYVVQAGACRRCGVRIDPVHPVAEVLGATLAATAILILPAAEAALVSALGLALFAAAIIDLRTRRLPDRLTAIAATLSLSLAALGGAVQVISGLIAATVTFVLLEGLRRGFLASGKPALGIGDVKLLSALALWLGAGTSWAVALAAVLGLALAALIRPSDGRIPFGPPIALAALTVGIALEAGLVPHPLEGLT